MGRGSHTTAGRLIPSWADIFEKHRVRLDALRPGLADVVRGTARAVVVVFVVVVGNAGRVIAAGDVFVIRRVHANADRIRRVEEEVFFRFRNFGSGIRWWGWWPG